jgi:hypothetical protein
VQPPPHWPKAIETNSPLALSSFAAFTVPLTSSFAVGEGTPIPTLPEDVMFMRGHTPSWWMRNDPEGYEERVVGDEPLIPMAHCPHAAAERFELLMVVPMK